MVGTTICLTGDIYPTKKLSPVSAEVDKVLKLLRSADVTIGNFEIPLTDVNSPLEKLLNIRAHPSIAQDLSCLGLNIATLANNHSVDHGWDGLRQTADILNTVGIQVVGAGKTLNDAMRECIITTRAGIRIGVLGLSCLLPTGSAAGANRPGIAPVHVRTSYEIDPYYQMEEPGDISAVKVRTEVCQVDLSRCLDAVRRLKQRCDVAIISIHWGFGSGDALAEYQLDLGRALIEAGADIVHGHHPHSVHPVVFHHGKPILCSMNVLVGQQVFLKASEQVQAMWAAMSNDGFVSFVKVSFAGPAEVEIVPTILDGSRMPTKAQGIDFERIKERLSLLSAPFGTKLRETEDGRLFATS